LPERYVVNEIQDQARTNHSFNGKLRDELLNRKIFYTLEEAKILIETWRKEYNQARPHSLLGYRPPAPVSFQPDLSDTPILAVMPARLT
jgi:hypothetical protein